MEWGGEREKARSWFFLGAENVPPIFLADPPKPPPLPPPPETGAIYGGVRFEFAICSIRIFSETGRALETIFVGGRGFGRFFFFRVSFFAVYVRFFVL